MSVPIHGSLIETDGIDCGWHSTLAHPLFEVRIAMSIFVKDIHPRSVRGGGKDRIALPHSEVLGDRGKTFNSRKLVCLAVNIGIDFLPLE